MYPYPDANQAWRGPIGGAVLLYRAGRVLHRFAGAPIWKWEFQDSGKRIVYQQETMHGGRQTCVLADVESGKMIALWGNQSGEKKPDWADLCQAP